MKRLVYLATVALVAMMILVPTAMAQNQKAKGQQTVMTEQTVKQETTQPLPKSGGPVISGPSVLLPAAALLLGGGTLGYAVLRRR